MDSQQLSMMYVSRQWVLSGVALAMVGVIACPITSGDTAFRSARLVLADWFKIDQGKMQKRLVSVCSASCCWRISSDIWIIPSYGDTSAGPTRHWL